MITKWTPEEQELLSKLKLPRLRKAAPELVASIDLDDLSPLEASHMLEEVRSALMGRGLLQLVTKQDFAIASSIERKLARIISFT